MNYFLCILIMYSTIFSSSYAVELNERIRQLLPGLLVEFNIEPKIPDDYVAMAASGNLNTYDWIYWGPKEVLETYFKDENSLKTPLIRTKLSANVAQTGLNCFNDSDLNKEFFAKQVEKDPESCSYKEYKWGKYPVFAVKMTMMNLPVYVAHVGLNAEGGWVLMFNLVYPKREKGPSESDVAFWNDFLENTKG